MGNSQTKKKQQLDELVNELSHRNDVLAIKRNYYFIQVTFKTGITEYWALNEKALKKRQWHVFRLPDGPYFKNEINTYSQFETNPLDPQHELLKDHFIIKRKDIKNAGWCDVRCKVHNLTSQLFNQGWLDIKYPNDVLAKDYVDLRESSYEKHKSSLIRYSAFDGHAIGRRLILYFMPTLAKENWEIYPIYHSLNKLVGGLYDITRERLVYDLSLKHHTVRFPGFYRSIFNRWYSVAGRDILDLYPDWGFKALSVLVDGGNYHYVGNQMVPLARLAKFVDGNVAPYKEGNHYDLAMVSDIHPISLNEIDKRINKYSSIADNLMVTVAREDWQTAIDLYKPWRVLRIKNVQGKTANEDNYVFIIGQR